MHEVYKLKPIEVTYTHLAFGLLKVRVIYLATDFEYHKVLK